MNSADFVETEQHFSCSLEVKKILFVNTLFTQTFVNENRSSHLQQKLIQKEKHSLVSKINAL